MNETALAFGTDTWASVVMTDPEAHKWGAPPIEYPRFRKLFTAIRRKTIDVEYERAVAAAREMARCAAKFVSTQPGYEPNVVANLLDESTYQKHFADFTDAASRAHTKPPRRSKTEALPKLDAIQSLERDATSVIEDVRANGAAINIEIVTPEAQVRQNLFWFVFDPVFPVEFANALTGKLEAETAFILARCATGWPNEDRIELMRQRVAGIRRFARFVAGVPGSRMTTIPKAEQLDVAAILAKTRASTEKFRSKANEELAK